MRAAAEPRRLHLARILAAGLLALLLAPGDLLSQYFGRNKVQYDVFDFRVLHTDHFDLHYYPVAEAAARDMAREAERWNERLSRIFGHELADRKSLILYADDADFRQTNVVAGFVGEGTRGITEGLKNRVVMPMAGSYPETAHVLGHELVHVFQFDLAQRDAAGFRMGALPLWFVEGMAEYLTLGHEHALTAMWMRDAVFHDRMPTVTDLGDPRVFPYRYGHALMAYVAGEWGPETIVPLYRAAGRAGVEGALVGTLGIGSDSLSALWAEATRAWYEPLLDGRTPPAEAGTLLLGEEAGGGGTNLGPALSPDGDRVAFLSQRALFGIELFLADARTGRVLRSLGSEESDRHFDAIRFIDSAGDFSPDGRHLAFVVYQGGENRIALYDVERGRVRARLPVEGVSTVQNPVWGPDSRTIAFTGLRGGISDLYTMDAETREVTRLTDSRAAALHPAWSPDGRTIAFVTDGGGESDFERLEYGHFRVALLDVESGDVRPLELFEGATHTNPRFSPDGRTLYFVADPDGFQDVYRVRLGAAGAAGMAGAAGAAGTGDARGAAGRAAAPATPRGPADIERITRLATGVSGLSELAPALSVARRSGRMVFSVFERGNYHVYALEPEEIEARAEPVPPDAPGERPLAFRPDRLPDGDPVPEDGLDGPLGALLAPPEAASRGQVETYLADAESGLPPSDDFPDSRYSPRLELDFIGSPGVGIATGGIGGTGLAGGVSFFFSDMLGNQVLSAAVAAQGTLRDVGGQVLYRNQERRLNWGIDVGRIPFLSARISQGPVDVPIDGEVLPGEAIRRVLTRTYLNEAALVGQYPFNINQRLEARAGYTRIGFHVEEETFVFVGGSLIDRFRETADAPDAIDLFEGSTALVRDNSYFGFTSPVRGTRYRLQAGGTAGDLSFLTALADYRRYLFLEPVTFAVRALHFGRYLGDAEDGRLRPVFLGQPSLVRGYDIYSLRADEWPMLEHRLVGSRIGVASAELRIPLLGVEEFGLITFPWLPTELSLFFDGGLTWTSERSPVFRWEETSAEQTPIFSAGASARVNVLGALVLEIYWVNPFQRPGRGAHWGLQLAPGW